MNFIKIESSFQPHIGLIQLDRPKELNALSVPLMAELKEGLRIMDEDPNVRVIIITGNEKAFAAGADIKQMTDKGAIEMLLIDQFSTWDQIKKTKKPIIAAVSGYALGGGCELAMICDMIVASESAKFGQPEIKLGIMPGAGGTQRLTRALGKAKAMEMILTGSYIGAEEALKAGLVNMVVPVDLYMEEAVKLAKKITAMSPIAVNLAKESVNRSFETHLEEGLHFERKNFYLLFATEDHKEGIDAFVNKRQPKFLGK